MSNLHRLQKERLRHIAIIGVASGIGAPDPGCGDGPGALEAIGLADKLRSADRCVAWKTTIYPLEGSDKVAVVAECASRLASFVSASMAAGDLPVVIGGDHSCAIGSWRGVAQALAGQPLGMLWIDAHLDSHTPDTKLARRDAHSATTATLSLPSSG